MNNERIANLAQLGVARAKAIANFNAHAAECTKMAAETDVPAEQQDKKLIELETARAIMLHAMAEYRAAVNSLVPGTGPMPDGV